MLSCGSTSSSRPTRTPRGHERGSRAPVRAAHDRKRHAYQRGVPRIARAAAARPITAGRALRVQILDAHAWIYVYLAAWLNWYFTFGAPGQSAPESIRGVRISPDFFSMLGVQPSPGPQPALLVLLSASALVLLIACANLAKFAHRPSYRAPERSRDPHGARRQPRAPVCHASVMVHVERAATGSPITRGTSGRRSASLRRARGKFRSSTG
jgi:hypothetical protein